ncbi:MAG: helicase SNF2 [Gammaproteobacteria bacterium]|nr:MAG: helicase SNF2 [Gammaproteobacteria bacterium]
MNQRRRTITFDDVIELCGSVATSRGRAYKSDRRVQSLELEDKTNKLYALVTGSAAQPYAQTISLASHRLRGECSCPVGVNCKHVAAVLLTWIDLQGQYRSEAHDSPANVVDRWMQQIIEANDDLDAGIETHEPGEPLLFYQLDYGALSHERKAFTLQILQSRLLKRGGYGKETPYRHHSHFHHPDWVMPSDHAILALLGGRTSNFSYQPLTLENGIGHLVLDKLMETERCFYGSEREQPLRRGPTRQLEFHWHQDADGMHRLEVLLAGGDDDGHTDWRLIPTDPPWYLLADEALAGPLEQTPNAQLLAHFIDAPPIPDDMAQSVSNALASRLARHAPPMPKKPDFVRIDEPPKPVLILQSRDQSPNPLDYFASIHFRYGDYTLPFEGEMTETTLEGHTGDGHTLILKRRVDAERALVVDFGRRFQDFQPALSRNPEFYSLADRIPQARGVQQVVQTWRHLCERQDELEANGWQVIVREPFSLSFESVTRLEAEISDTGSNWFDMALKLRHGDQRFDLLPLVIDWLQNGASDDPILLQSDSGQWLEIPPELFRPVASTLLELYDEPGDSDTLRLPRQRAGDLDVLGDAWDDDGFDVEWQGAETLRALADAFGDIDSGSIEAAEQPANVSLALRPYQLEGLGWLNFLARHGFNGILADDMGLGKTLQTLAHIADQQARGALDKPTLIVAPTSLLGNWAREIERFVPTLTAAIWHGTQRSRAALERASPDIVITSYSLVTRDFDFLDAFGFGLLVLDEAQAIKNPAAKVTQMVKQFAIDRRICLTGTPLENHLGELWSQFDFLMPGLLYSRKFFTRHFRTPIEVHGDAERQERLAQLIRPFLLRRRKEAVAADLPPKTEIIREVALKPEQAKLYESIRVSMEQRVRTLLKERGLARSHIELLDALLKLRQTCCHPNLVKLASARGVEESAKTDLLMSMLEELIDEGKKVLLFSQFTEMLAIIETEVKKRRLPFVKLTGRTRKRTEAIDAFQYGDIPLFLISLKAGGTGLNLTAADTVIHYDPWWNPAVEAQASDRAHRIGQDKPVFIYKLVASETVEEKILVMQEKKKILADQTLDSTDTGALRGLSTEDVLELFAAHDFSGKEPDP